MKRTNITGLCVAAILLFVSASIHGQAFVDLEGGAAFTGYNIVSIPAGTGSLISLKDQIVSDPAMALRIRLGYTIADRHTVSVLIAPLTVHGSGILKENITYQGKTFLQGTAVESIYRFDSYRLTYRYSFIKTDTLNVAAGITGKIRSADIAIMSDTGYAHRTDLGVVPLLSFALRWDFLEPFSLLVDTDALVTPFGRAEDALVALQYSPNDTVTYRLGYRILEGGADGGGKVYTFSLFNYVTAGITVSF